MGYIGLNADPQSCYFCTKLPCTWSWQSSHLQSIPRVSPASPDVFSM